MELLIKNIQFSYSEATEFCSAHWYWNPQQIPCFEAKYFELAETEPRLPRNPREAFKDDVGFFAFSSVFGDEFYTFREAEAYCSDEYKVLSDNEKPLSLQSYYQQLGASNGRLPRCPNSTYKGKGWKSFREIFGLPEKEECMTYSEAQAYCSEQYEGLSDDEKPPCLMSYYRELRASNDRLPSNPHTVYKATGWQSLKAMFRLPEKVSFFVYTDAEAYCSEKYEGLSDNEKPSCLMSYYRQLRASNDKLPSDPLTVYKGAGWQSIRAMFGLPEKEAFMTYVEAQAYCSEQYEGLSDDETPPRLMSYYREIRASNSRLPSNPNKIYKNAGWQSIRAMFGLPEKEAFMTYVEAQAYCSKQYEGLPDDEKPRSLISYYQELRASHSRLPSEPHIIYKGKGWESFKAMFRLY